MIITYYSLLFAKVIRYNIIYYVMVMQYFNDGNALGITNICSLHITLVMNNSFPINNYCITESIVLYCLRAQNNDYYIMCCIIPNSVNIVIKNNYFIFL